MKTFASILLMVLFVGFSRAQTDKNLIKEKWKPGKENVIFGYSVLRMEGKNDRKGITNVAYQPYDKFLTALEEKAKDEKWSEQKQNKEVSHYKELAPGGVIHVYVTRPGFKMANTNHFSVILKDSTEKEILHTVLQDDIPEPIAGSDYWSNHVTVPLGEKPRGSVYVYVIDKYEGAFLEYKFRVKL